MMRWGNAGEGASPLVMGGVLAVLAMAALLRQAYLARLQSTHQRLAGEWHAKKSADRLDTF